MGHSKSFIEVLSVEYTQVPLSLCQGNFDFWGSKVSEGLHIILLSQPSGHEGMKYQFIK